MYILVVDDDLPNQKLVQYILETQGGYDVVAVESAEAALPVVRTGEPALVVLDVAMPGMDGLQLCRELRRGSRVPILMLSAMAGVPDRVRGLQLGADDYLGKPYDPGELLERVRALLRRAAPIPRPVSSPQMTVGDFRFNLLQQTVWVRGRGPIQLTRVECRLLYLLATRSGVVWNRPALLAELWGDAAAAATDGAHAIDTYVARLRQKIETNPDQPEYVCTVRRLGYRLVHRWSGSAEANDDGAVEPAQVAGPSLG